MTQDEKDLLLKDLCGRLHICNCINGTALTIALDDERPMEANQWCITNYDCYMGKLSVLNIIYASDEERTIDIEYIKPYLFPMSSMSEEKVYEFYCRFVENDIAFDDFVADYWNTNSFHKVLTSIDDVESIMDWYNKNHVDYRGLIDNGLAIDATSLNIY